MPGKPKDMTGRRYGKLVAVRLLRTEKRRTFWLFRCDCGKDFEGRIDQAVTGNTRSCGCIRSREGRGLPACPVPTPRLSPVELAGRRFGRLTVVEEADRRPGRRARRWLCRCDCGAVADVEQRSLMKGDTKSCGCLHREKAAQQAARMGAANITHGMVDSPEWLAWKNMHARCGDPSQRSYPRYGGRGIVVCERWQSFEHFYADVGPRPSPEHSIDRKDNDGNYEPGNCRWATRQQQARNRISNRLLAHNGETRCLAAWAESAGMKTYQLYRRLRNGWGMAEALSVPVARGVRRPVVA